MNFAFTGAFEKVKSLTAKCAMDFAKHERQTIGIKTFANFAINLWTFAVKKLFQQPLGKG